MTFLDWNERYRPKRLSEILGNPSAVREMYNWASEWEHKIPAKRALLLYGSPGTGKTSAALALASDMGWSALEMNASDIRNAAAIEQSVAQGAVNETFMADGSFKSSKEGGRKLIIIDEADSLYERTSAVDGEASDSGGRRAIVDMIKKTKQPVILIVNDVYALTKESTGAQLKRLTLRISFKKVPRSTVAKRIMEIAREEGVRMEAEAAEMIASRTGGDMRAALNDLQALCSGRTILASGDVDSMGRRDAEQSIYGLLANIFGGMSGTSAYSLSKKLDEAPDTMLLWVDENLPGAYRDPDDLARAYDCLSRADIYLTRARRNSHYGLWPYATFMMTGGVAMSKRMRYPSFPRFEFPRWLMAMSRSKSSRSLRTDVVSKIGIATHSSRAEVINDILPYVSTIFQRDEEFRVSLSYNLMLSKEEIAFVMDDDSNSPAVLDTLAGVQRMVDKYGEPGIESPMFFHETVDAIHKKSDRTKDEDKAEPPKPLEESRTADEDDGGESEKQRTLFDF